MQEQQEGFSLLQRPPTEQGLQNSIIGKAGSNEYRSRVIQTGKAQKMNACCFIPRQNGEGGGGGGGGGVWAHDIQHSVRKQLARIGTDRRFKHGVNDPSVQALCMSSPGCCPLTIHTRFLATASPPAAALPQGINEEANMSAPNSAGLL